MNRREFLGSSATSALNAAGVAAGVAGWTSLSTAAASTSPSERVRMAVIGVRNQGKLLAATFAALPDVEVVSLCDVDAGQLPEAAQAVARQTGTSPRLETDFRRVLDDSSLHAVVVAAPDHWHAEMTNLACQAGKDVYLETPVTHSFDEGPGLLAAVTRHGRIVQTGLQQRSGGHFQAAIEFVRSGRLGVVHLAKAWTVHERKSIGFRKDGAAPEGVDYDLWLGPAAARAFNPNRFHYNWHWFWDYGSGALGNWGVHLLDVARWGLGVELPSRVAAAGGKFHFHDDQQTPDTLHVTYSYPRATITWEHRLWSAHAPEGRSAAVAFYGDRGTLIVDRGGWKVYGQRESTTGSASELLTPHAHNFIECVKTRQQPAADLGTGVVTSALCHLGNVAYRVGRTLSLDSKSGEIVGDLGAAMLARSGDRSAQIRQA